MSLRDWSSDVCSSDLSVLLRVWKMKRSANGKGVEPVPTETRRTVAVAWRPYARPFRSEEHTSELQSRRDLVCRLLHEKKKKKQLSQLNAHQRVDGTPY